MNLAKNISKGPFLNIYIGGSHDERYDFARSEVKDSKEIL
jgi:hypothetical protein